MRANIILCGPMNSGKTSSIKTIPEPYEVFMLATEPGDENIFRKEGFDLERFHLHYVPTARPSWDTLIKNAELISSLSNEGLTKINKMNQQDYEQYLQLLNVLMGGYKCQLCGKEPGSVDNWGEDKVLVLDGLTGLTIMATDLVVGSKPIKSKPDYLVIMDNLERGISKLTNDLRCSFILTAHVSRTIDEVAGGTNVTVDTIGQKLAPRIPRFFDECIWTRRDKDRFYWSTVEANTELKTRFLPFRDDLPQDFGQIFTEPPNVSSKE